MSTWSLEYESPVSPARIYKAFVLDWHDLGPKIVPEVISSATIVEEGEGGAGSIRQINFTPVMPFSYVKERLDFVDHENYECKASVVEGGDLGKKLKSASAHFKVAPKSGGGSVCKVVGCYEALPGVDCAGDEAKAKESFKAQLKAIETYLLANPTAYA